MKKYILLMLVTLTGFSALQTQAQPHDGEKKEGMKKIKALYIAYISKELSLTEVEAQKFWPVHNQYETELKAVHQKKLAELDKEEAVLTIKKSYKEKFVKVIGAERTDAFYKKDKEFRNKMMEMIGKKRKNEGGNKKNQKHPAHE